MPLHHVSENGVIETFVPRVSPSGGTRPVVWAVDHAHLPNYLVPRECPRVCFRADPMTSRTHSERFLGANCAPVVGVELRVVDDLVSLAAEVAGSTLAFS